jgi:hypothetical protein
MAICVIQVRFDVDFDGLHKMPDSLRERIQVPLSMIEPNYCSARN